MDYDRTELFLAICGRFLRTIKVEWLLIWWPKATSQKSPATQSGGTKSIQSSRRLDECMSCGEKNPLNDLQKPKHRSILASWG
jgi:hypothetical protein